MTWYSAFTSGRDKGGTQDDGGIDREESAAVLLRGQDLLGVLTAQLGDVVVGTEEAAFGVMSEVQAVDAEVEALSGLAQELVRRCRDGAGQVAETTRTNAGEVDELVTLVSDRDAAVLDLVGQVRELDREVDAIAAVAHATTILALNAKIEAVRAGDAGDGFSVVADEVRALSRQSAQAADSVRSGISRVTSLMEERLGIGVSTARGNSSQEINTRLAAIAAAQHDAAAALSESVEGTQEAAARIADSVAALGHRTTSVLAQAQFQDMTRQAVEGVVASLAQLTSQLGTVVGHLHGTEDVGALRVLDDAVASLRGSYVSQRQRAVDATQAGSTTTGPTTAAIELF